jgi:hypothetical protein
VLLIASFGRASRAHCLIELEPQWNQPPHVHREKAGEGSRLAADEEGGAFGGESVFVSGFRKKFQPDQSIHDCAKTPLGRARFPADLRDSLCSFLERIKNLVVTAAPMINGGA